MFNFTTTTLIHSLDQFAANPTNTTAGQVSSGQELAPSKNTLWVNGVNLFKKENVVAIYRNPFIKPLAGRLVVDVNGIWSKVSSMVSPATSARIRLKFSLRRTNDNNSYYARDEVFHGKDFVYEFIVTSTDSTNAVTKVAKQIKKINRLYGDIYLDVHVGTAKDDNLLNTYDENGKTSPTVSTSVGTANSATGAFDEMSEVDKLVFVNDNFGMFTDAVLEVWVDGHSDCCVYQDGGWIPFDQIECFDKICTTNCSVTACDNITRGIKESTEELLHIVDCVNGTGTYQQILRDLRLPTMENLAYGSLTQQMNEMPVPGMNYVQYTLHYVTCRGILGGSAVGEVTHSKTTHVFFVPATCCTCEGSTTINTYDIDAAFQQALYDAFGWSACTGEEGSEAPVGRLVPAPHDDPTVEPHYYNQLAPASEEDTRTSNDTETPQPETGIKSSEVGGGGGDVPNLFDVREEEASSGSNSGSDSGSEQTGGNG